MSLLCALPLIGALVCPAAPPAYVGYVEGDARLIGPVGTARIARIEVAEGAQVAAGDLLAVLEETDARAAQARAAAALAQAEAVRDNLATGRRPEEIAALEATVAAATAAADQAAREAERVGALVDRGSAPSAQGDAARAARDSAVAAQAQAAAQLAAARLPARPAERAAAEAAAEGARAALAEADWLLAERRIIAPAAGQVTDILRRPGEVAGPAAPVLRLLPDDARHILFFVPEAARAGFAPGQRVALTCTGCPAGLSATVTDIAAEPEFTPPVIYSEQARDALVYRLRATPEGTALRPGQIVDVTP